MRPRPFVDFDVPLPPTEVLERAKRALKDAPGCAGHVGKRELSLEVAGLERHPFSPRISLDVRPTDHGAHVRGYFGPHPNLWTLFVFVYAAQVAVFVAGSVLGFVQLSLDQSPVGLLAAAGAVVGLTLSCSVDLLGRRKGKPQMTTLCNFIHEVYPELIERSDESCDLGRAQAPTPPPVSGMAAGDL